MAFIIARGSVVSIHARIPYPAQPVIPCNVSAVHQDRLIVAMVADVFEEDAAAERGDLEGGDVDVGVEGTPCVCAYAVGYQSSEEAVGVEEEEDGQDAAYQQLDQEYPALY